MVGITIADQLQGRVREPAGFQPPSPRPCQLHPHVSRQPHRPSLWSACTATVSLPSECVSTAVGLRDRPSVNSARGRNVAPRLTGSPGFTREHADAVERIESDLEMQRR